MLQSEKFAYPHTQNVLATNGFQFQLANHTIEERVPVKLHITTAVKKNNEIDQTFIHKFGL